MQSIKEKNEKKIHADAYCLNSNIHTWRDSLILILINIDMNVNISISS